MDKVLLIGEPMELLLAEEEGALSDVTHFRASVSGAEMNVAVGLARLGLCPRFMTRLGSDPRAVRIRRFMNENAESAVFLSRAGFLRLRCRSFLSFSRSRGRIRRRRAGIDQTSGALGSIRPAACTHYYC